MSKVPNHLFEADISKKFIDDLDSALQNTLRGDGMGTDTKLYEHLWYQMSNPEIATVYLTVLMGKLMKMESNSLRMRQDNNNNIPDCSFDENNPDADNIIENEIKLRDVVKELNLGTQKADPQHPLLIKRKEPIMRRTSMIIQADEKVSEYVMNTGIMNKVEPPTPAPITSPSQIAQQITLKDDGDDQDNEDTPTQHFAHPVAVGASVNYAIPQSNQKNYSYSTSIMNDRLLFTRPQLIERYAIMNSLIYVSLFYKFDLNNPSLLFLLHDWKNLRAQQLMNNNMLHDSLTEEVREALCPPTGEASLYKYLFQCADYDVVRETDTVLRPNLSNYDPLAVVGTYVYCRLQPVFRAPKYTDLVLQQLTTLIRNASTTPNNLSENYDPTALKNALNLVKMVLPQLYIHPSVSRDLVELMTVIQNFFLEPCPIGSLCHEILGMCYQEQNNRGSLTRKRFEKSIRIVKGDDGAPIEKRRRVHILFNGQAEYAHHLVDRFNVNNGELNPTEVQNTKANLALNVYEQNSEKDLQALSADLEKNVPISILCQNYRQIVENVNDPQALREIATTMLKEAQSAKGGALVVRKQSPAMPEVEFNLIELPEEEDLAKREFEKKVFPRSVIYDQLKELIEAARTEEVPDSNNVILLDVAVAGGSGTLQHFVHSVYVAHKNNLFTPTDAPRVELQVYLIPLGENNYLSSWLEKYDGWYSRHLHYPMLARINMIPQLKPTRRYLPHNSGSSDSSGDNSQDGIDDSKNRQKRNTIVNQPNLNRRSVLIASPVKTYNKRRTVQVSNYKAPTKFLTPHRFMRTLLSDYVIDANETLPVHIYNVQCLCHEVMIAQQGTQSTRTRGRRVQSFLSLSFCQRLDIGVYAEALQFQRDNKLDGMSLEELVQHRQFKYQGVQLNVSYVPMDPTGELNRSSEINEQTKTYQSISVKSTSRFGDKGSLVGPNQPWLEVFADENLSTQKQRDKRKVKLRDCDMGTQYHVGSISIESPSASMFSILMDGELYGPFHKVIINASDYRFSLRTFNKVDVY
jgi:hypothetical protein